MASITFKAKVRPVTYVGEEKPAYYVVDVPRFARHHCDMAAFRQHPKFRAFANSDLFPNVLSRIRRDLFGGRDYLRLDAVPAGVSVDTSGFLAVVSLEV